MTKGFPIEDFFRVPFTHHIRIIEGTKDLGARYYYIHRTAEEHLSEKDLIKLTKEDAYGHREQMPSNFSQTIPDAAMMRKAVMMFNDSYLLDYINVEEIGLRDSIDVDERVVEKEIVNEKIRKPHENPSIGMVLCKSANRDYVEFVMRDYSKPMGVATYKTADDMPEHIRKALPDAEELIKWKFSYFCKIKNYSKLCKVWLICSPF